MASGTVGGTFRGKDNQAITGVKRVIDVNAVPYQNRGQGYAKPLSNGREVIAGLNDVGKMGTAPNGAVPIYSSIIFETT